MRKLLVLGTFAALAVACKSEQPTTPPPETQMEQDFEQAGEEMEDAAQEAGEGMEEGVEEAGEEMEEAGDAMEEEMEEEE